MNTKQNNIMIDDSFKNYEMIQNLHIEILRSNSVPDLAAMNLEREKQFLILKTGLENMMENAGLNHGTDCIDQLGKYENRLASIMQLDDKIAIEIKRYRNVLKENLKRMKMGKDAMNGYKNAVSDNSSNSCVVSMNR